MNIKPVETKERSEDKLNVALIENPFEPNKLVRYQAEVLPGTLVAELITEDLGPMIVSINGKVLSDEEALVATVNPGDHMILAPVLQGGGSKGLLRIASLIAISALAFYTGGVALAALGPTGLGLSSGVAAFGAGLAAAAVSTVGGLVVNALLPVRPGSVDGFGDEPGSFGVDGPKSTSRVGIPIPVVYGTARIGPNRIGIYTEQLNGSSNQELFALFALCEGEITGILPESIEINDQPIDQFEDDEVTIGTVLTGTDIQPLPDFFGDRTITPYNVGQTLQVDNTISYTTSGPVDRFRVDLLAQSLFKLNDKGGKELARVEFEVKYRNLTTNGPFIPLTGSDASVNILDDSLVAKIYGATTTSLTDDLSPLDNQRRALNTTTDPAIASANADKTFKPHLVEVVIEEVGNIYGGRSSSSYRRIYRFKDLTAFPTVFQDYSAAKNTDLYGARRFFVIDEAQTRSGTGTPFTTGSLGQRTIPTTNIPSGEWVYSQSPGGWVAKRIVGFLDAEFVSKVGGNIGIEGATSNAVRATFESPTLQNGVYRIDVKRLTPPSSTGTDEIILSSINEILLSGTSYPRTALMPLKFKITERFASLPNVTVAVVGRKVKVRRKIAAAAQITTVHSNSTLWGGSDRDDASPSGVGSTYYEWVYETSSNPAWVSYDMLTDKFIGAGISESKIDIDRWQEWADYCSSKGLEFNAVLENESNLWDCLQTVFRSGHAQILPIGSRFSVAIERADLPVMLFSVANINKTSFQVNYLPRSNRIDEVTMSYYDRDDGWKPKDVTVRDPEADPNANPRIQNFQSYWITSKDQAVKDGNLKINLAKGMTHTIQFESPVEAIGCTVGDQILVQHDMPRWSQGGRLEAGSTASVLQLDRPVTMVAGSTYQVMLQYDTLLRLTTTVFAVMGTNQTNDTITFANGTPDGPVRRVVVAGVEYAVSRVVMIGGRAGLVLADPIPANSVGASVLAYDVDALVTRTVVTAPGDQSVITCSSAFPVVPAQYVKWVFGKTDTIRRPYRVSGITAGTSSYNRTITAYEYKSEYYNLDAIIETPQPRVLIDLGHVRDLVYTQDNIVVDNVFLPELDVSWLTPDGPGYAGADVFLSIGNQQFFLHEQVRDGRLGTRIKGLPIGATVAVKVLAVDTFGRRAIGDPPLIVVEIAPDKIPPGVPTFVTATAELRSVVFAWTKPTDSDFKSVLVYSGSTFATATVVAESSGNGVVYFPPDETVRNYWLVSTDYAGNLSGPHSPAGIQIAARQFNEDDIGSDFVDNAILPKIPPGLEVLVLPTIADAIQFDRNVTSTRALYPSSHNASLREDPIGAFGQGCYSIEKAASNLVAPASSFDLWTISSGTRTFVYSDWYSLTGAVTFTAAAALVDNQPYSFAIDVLNESAVSRSVTLSGAGATDTFQIAPGQYRRVFISNTKAAYVADDRTLTVATTDALLVRRPQFEQNAYATSFTPASRTDQFIDYAGFGGRFNYSRLSFLGWVQPLRAAGGNQVYLADSGSFTFQRNSAGNLQLIYGSTTVTTTLAPVVNSFNLIGFAAGTLENSLNIFLNDQVFSTTIGSGLPNTPGVLTVGNLGSSRSLNVSECRLNSFAMLSDTLVTASRAKQIYGLRAPFIDPASKVIAPRPSTVSLAFV